MTPRRYVDFPIRDDVVEWDFSLQENLVCLSGGFMKGMLLFRHVAWCREYDS